jgi:hypothetical protein
MVSSLSSSLRQLAFLSLLAIPLVTAAPASAQQPDSSVVRFFKQKHQFDTLKQGPGYDYTFRFTNTGAEPLLINRVRTPCQCLTPEWPQEAIDPGDTGAIKVTYFSDNRPGPFFKSIQVHTSVTKGPLQLLYVEGYVREEGQ